MRIWQQTWICFLFCLPFESAFDFSNGVGCRCRVKSKKKRHSSSTEESQSDDTDSEDDRKRKRKKLKKKEVSVSLAITTRFFLRILLFFNQQTSGNKQTQHKSKMYH